MEFVNLVNNVPKISTTLLILTCIYPPIPAHAELNKIPKTFSFHAPFSLGLFPLTPQFPFYIYNSPKIRSYS